MIKRVDAPLSDELVQCLCIGMKGPDVSAVTFFRLLPDAMCLREQSTGIESHNFDREPLGEDMMGDQLVFDSEAGREDDSPRSASDDCPQPLSDRAAGPSVQRLR